MLRSVEEGDESRSMVEDGGSGRCFPSCWARVLFQSLLEGCQGLLDIHYWSECVMDGILGAADRVAQARIVVTVGTHAP
ncbi:hypothetical protein [Streptomyces chartreusis]|uniref:hypothetical protein n=1 Tax=Streptomyces chartreusis TaxID=1969 RepID=UPI00380401DB